MTAAGEFAEPLAALGLDTLEGVFDYSGAGYLRTHANRDNFHIVFEKAGRHVDLYLKRHRGFELKEALKLLMAREPMTSAGRREWENLLRLQRLGIQAPRRVAFGEKRLLGFERRSFVITEAIASAVPLDEYLGSLQGDQAQRGAALLVKRALLWDLGEIVRRLHGAGLTHMDLYLSHFLVREKADGDMEIFLIDLQRMARRWLFKRRWIIKDLAALLYSARDVGLSKTDFGRFFSAYFDGTPSRAQKRLLRAALGRASRMARRRRS